MAGIDERLLAILVCPQCRGPLVERHRRQIMICEACALAYPIREGIPVLLLDEARALD